MFKRVVIKNEFSYFYITNKHFYKIQFENNTKKILVFSKNLIKHI